MEHTWCLASWGPGAVTPSTAHSQGSADPCLLLAHPRRTLPACPPPPGVSQEQGGSVWRGLASVQTLISPPSLQPTSPCSGPPPSSSWYTRASGCSCKYSWYPSCRCSSGWTPPTRDRCAVRLAGWAGRGLLPGHGGDPCTTQGTPYPTYGPRELTLQGRLCTGPEPHQGLCADGSAPRSWDGALWPVHLVLVSRGTTRQAGWPGWLPH